jgi:hypothetical protein
VHVDARKTPGHGARNRRARHAEASTVAHEAGRAGAGAVE